MSLNLNHRLFLHSLLFEWKTRDGSMFVCDGLILK